MGRRFHRRHHRALAGRGHRRVRAVLPGAAGRDRLVGGGRDGGFFGGRAPQPGSGGGELCLARAIANREAKQATLAGLVLIAPAPDFTEQLMWNAFSDEVREEIRTKGVWMRPSEYGDGAPYPITRALIEEGRNHLLLGSAIEVGCPVRILQGAQDPDVPWQHGCALQHRLPAEDVVLTMIQDGDHRLSRPQDIASIMAAVAEMG